MEKLIRFSNDDYDLYKILLPFSIWKKKNQNRHISIEMGKLHPCFAESCNFDYKLHLGKKGFWADVVVINKDKLKEYEKKFPGKKFCVNEVKSKKLFCKQKKNRIAFVVLGAFAAASLPVFLSQNKMDSMQTNATEVLENKKSKVEFYAQNNPLYYLEDLLEKIKIQGGSIENFNWKTDGFFSVIDGDVLNVYPEDISVKNCETHFSSLQFAENRPEFHLQLKARFTQAYETPIPPPIDSEGKKKIREIIRQYEGKIIEETVEPLEFVFDCNLLIKKNENSLFSELSEYLGKMDIRIQEVSISKGKSLERVRLLLNSNIPGEKETLLQLLQSNVTLFVSPSPAPNTTPKKSENNFQPAKGEKVLGKVVHKDGSISSFYKNESGKIEIRRIK